jgi:hypothetical protein
MHYRAVIPVNDIAGTIELCLRVVVITRSKKPFAGVVEAPLETLPARAPKGEPGGINLASTIFRE